MNINIYDKTITILNRLKAVDSSTKKIDVYYKTVLENCGWYEQAISDVDGIKVSMSTTFKIFIPFTGKFLPYNEWKKGNTDSFFTVSQGDTIILGEVEEDITPQTITKIKQNYEPNVCEVRHCRVCDKRNGIEIQLYVEGI